MRTHLQISLLLFLFFLLLYCISMPGYVQIYDSAFSLKTAESIVHRHALDIRTGPADAGMVFTHDGRTYSKYGIGLAFIWVPFVAVAKVVAAKTGLPSEFVTSFFVSTYSIFFGAAACVLFYGLLREFRINARNAVLVTFGLGIGTICWKYSVYDFSEIVQMMFLIGAMTAAMRNTNASVALMTACLSACVFVKIASVLYIPLFLAYLAWRNRAAMSALVAKGTVVALVGGCLGGVLLYLNFARFGSPFESGYGTQAAMISGDWLGNVSRLLFSGERGLFYYSPLLIFSVFGAVVFFRHHPAEALLAAALFALNLGFHATFQYYDGGWCWGPRYLVPMVFLILIPAALALQRSPALRSVFVILLIASSGVQVLSVLEKDQEYLVLRDKFSKEERDRMPPPIAAHAIIVQHKLEHGNTTYNARQFGLNYDRWLDLSAYSTFRGFNLWYVHVGRRLSQPRLYWVPAVVAPFLLLSGFLAWRLSRRDDTSAPCDPVLSQSSIHAAS